MIQNTILTTNQASPINARPIPACLRILNPSLYFPSSPAAVTIWKPAQSNITNVIRERIPSTQLIKLLITVINPPAFDVPEASVTPAIPPASVVVPNPHWLKPPPALTANIPSPNRLTIPTPNSFNANFFIIFCWWKIKIFTALSVAKKNTISILLFVFEILYCYFDSTEYS